MAINFEFMSCLNIDLFDLWGNRSRKSYFMRKLRGKVGGGTYFVCVGGRGINFLKLYR